MNGISGKIHSIETFGTVDGPGIRFIVFFQGCPLQCKYCQNRDTWNFAGGTEMTVDDIIGEFEKYLNFYWHSGGGLTASGGEPSMQPEFLYELFKAVKDYNLNTAINTSGFVEIEKAKIFLPQTDLVILDLKMIDPEKHQELTGVKNEKILDFARYLDRVGKKVWIRHVVIPGLTDKEEDIKEMTSFIKNLKNVEKVELLPYHTLGRHKWKELGSEYPLEGIDPPDRKDMERIKDKFSTYGVQVKI